MIVDVAVPVKVDTSFHYLFESEWESQLKIGAVLEVPFRNHKTYGFVLGFPETSQISLDKLKNVENVLVAEPVFDPQMLEFLRWVSEYYCHPIGEVIATAIPRTYWEGQKATIRPRKKASLKFEISQKPIPELTSEQQEALKVIQDPAETRPVLLHGVTGSGKTEVYMRVLREALDRGEGGMVLVPEIALTPQLVERFCGRFGERVAVLHSDLTPLERYRQWERLKSGEAQIVVGARSAVFAPVPNLKAIIVDEEHETSFKQEDSLRYHARDLAVMRGKLLNAKVILGSATPSLESIANAHSGKYGYVRMKSRIQDRPMPKALFVDLKEQGNLYSPKVPWLTKPLIQKMDTALRNQQQVLLYLNRLGFAHFLFCSDCGHTWRCHQCDVALTYYLRPAQLKCHYCGMVKPAPNQCEECKGTQLKTIGLGTEQVEAQLREIFPKARIGRMDRSQVKGRKELEAVLKSIANREVDIIVGTQMVTKGHDFPGISLVGILMADASLNLPDFRANERTFQIITQVSGRAGRAETPGEVVIQSVNPANPTLILAAENRSDEFYRRELNTRKLFGFPPYRRLVMLRFQHRQAPRVEQFARTVCEFIRLEITSVGYPCSILGPAEAPLSKLKNFYRWQSLIKGDNVKEVQKLLARVSEYVAQQKSSVQFAVDVDPLNSL